MPDRPDPRHRFNLTSIKRTRDVSCLILTFFVLISGTQLSAQVAPATSQLAGNSGGSVCDEGYENRGGSCLKDNVPENAYSTGNSYGQGWECNHGFRGVGGICEETEVPENAYLVSTGDRWKCNRLFRRFGEECEEVIAPENGFVETRFGVQETHCNWGFRKDGLDCVTIDVPRNGHLTDKKQQGWLGVPQRI